MIDQDTDSLNLDGQQVLVTGVSGFIGTHLVGALSRAGALVTGVDLRCPRTFAGERFEQLDVSEIDERWLQDREIGQIYHLASVVGVVEAATFGPRTEATIVDGTARLLGSASSLPQRPRFTYVSSSEVYGEAVRLPIVESMPKRPLSIYGKAKTRAEELVLSYIAAGASGSIVRPFNVYGPGQRDDFVIPRFVSQAARESPITIVGDGEQLRTFTYVDDFVRGLLLAGSAPALEGEPIFNIGGAEAWSIASVAMAIADELGSTSELEYVSPEHLSRPNEYEVRHRIASIGKARRALGYRPRVGLREGIRLVSESRAAALV